ncbi:hypothetical protein Poly21_57170 [Allorhodopirellula heiligendammensis]|uniref:Uncharacterized protein n=1 Tax=Allorhodopirellula heiligendammensis TaxID=2714739 RepID=A0A5C6B0R8_9BACT|nr:hypothetical protein Poly21_57170 [Allorhodopirellula heiligendammensis]
MKANFCSTPLPVSRSPRIFIELLILDSVFATVFDGKADLATFEFGHPISVASKTAMLGMRAFIALSQITVRIAEDRELSIHLGKRTTGPSVDAMVTRRFRAQ